ncbi:MAG: deoxyhypusine synthase family protein [Polyangiaceae bacterium]
MKKTLASRVSAAPKVRPAAISGKEKTHDLLMAAFPAYAGRQVREAYSLMRATVKEGAATFLTLSGAMTPAGIHSSSIIPLIERGLIDAITTTGANLYHDAHRVIGHAVHEIDPHSGDLELRQARCIRIYDLAFPEQALLDCDRVFSAMLRKPEFQKRMGTAELHRLLGKEMDALERRLGVKQPSLLSTAYRHDVPIFVGAVQDGSIFLNVVKLRALLGEEFRCEVDPILDVYEMSALQHYCQSQLKKKLAVWMLGGGVPKNYTLQGEPLLGQIFDIPTRGFDIDVQICVDVADNGALSPATAAEGHTWGKTSAESVQTGSVYCRADVTAVMPFIAHALLGDPKMKKRGLRLATHLDRARQLLDREVQKRRSALLSTLDFAGVSPSKSASRKRVSSAKPSRKRATPTKKRTGASSSRRRRG